MTRPRSFSRFSEYFLPLAAPMREELMKYMYTVVWENILRRDRDLEQALKEIGYSMGKLMVIMKGFKPEADLDALLYRTAYNFLPLFHESERVLQQSEEDRNTYYIAESTPLMTRYVSLPEEQCSICCDSIFAGAIEFVLKASGFASEVVAHNTGTASCPDRVTYEIRIIR
ncbi:trafficking protein particle complex subunit 5 [Pancytospora philotis]|nr:trafficking protein particle complex subunit 5 [Pancytospora philotis]